ncbi:chaoptin-like [Danaus plexippus]|uniref:chaoptin-like n=1 Tax=Danaus plexippus TaxID=13037 RepID=UPI002AB11A20|nr:chaoptin-like [Danaus plexippus]
MMFLHFMIILLAALPCICGECHFIPLPKLEKCRAALNCSITLTNPSSDLDSWTCIRRQEINYNYYYRNNYDKSYTLDTNYELYITLQGADINTSEDPLYALNSIRTSNVKTLSIIEGNLVSVSPDIYKLSMLEELIIVNNMVEKLNLAKLVFMSSLTTLNMSRNLISTIESVDFQIEASGGIHTVDLSYNQLETIPDNCFLKFPRLLYLDLSHNSIKKIELLTFEGMRSIETLLLSYNEIKNMGLNFVRFINLKKLELDHNELTSLSEESVKNLINLEHLNLSSNQLRTIQENSFRGLQKLQEIDLSNNQIKTVQAHLFQSNINLHTVYFSNNYIENIQDGAFDGTNITELSITGNCIVGTINSNTFLGVHVDSIDFSGGKITTIGDEAFSNVGGELTCLNLSRNSIEIMSKSCFKNLTALSKLDLSNNDLVEIDFDSRDLKMLEELYLKQNKIKKVHNIVFRDLESLLTLDLSENALQELQENYFEGLKNLETLLLNNNELHFLAPNVFKGLENLNKLDMSQTRIMSINNLLFEGLVSLEILNISRSQLKTIEFGAFDGTSWIKILDVSYNELENFTVSTIKLSRLTQLYLNHNRLKNITETTLSNMTSLEKINLSHNNISHIHSLAFRAMGHLNFVDLNFNIDMEIPGEVFNNLHISEVSLANIKRPFNFSQANNVSITTLILSECNISDIDSLFVYNIDNLQKILLQSNLITSLTKESFKRMPLLNSLELSRNRISFIQPGTFLLADMINTLYLNDNDLRALQFGSLDGLKNLRFLNLSSNAIREFNPKLLRGLPHISILYLENNGIVKIDFKEFAETSLRTLYVGQNPLACDQLTRLNITQYENLVVTVGQLDFHSENIDGIPCITYSTSTKDQTNNAGNEVTDKLTDLKVTVSLLQDIFSKNLNETTSISQSLKDILTHISNYKNEIITEHNNSERSLSYYLRELLNRQDSLRTVLVNSNINITEAIGKILIQFNNELSNWTKNFSNENIEAMKMWSYNNDKQTQLSTHPYTEQSYENNVKDSDSTYLLYILGIFLTIQSVLTIIFMFYLFIIKYRKKVCTADNTHDSRHPLNVMEIE